jgi:hypothetical protein
LEIQTVAKVSIAAQAHRLLQGDLINQTEYKLPMAGFGQINSKSLKPLSAANSNGRENS